jgi:hypothetical protein
MLPVYCLRSMKNILAKYSIVIVLVLMGFLFQWKYINEFPSHVHAWAQSDRYALALGFNRNEFDFFQPQTFVLNHQFPGSLEFANKSPVTAVDFPIHDYAVALLMNLFGSTSPWVFRLYVLAYSLVGLFFLFKTSNLLVNDKILSVLLVIFAATSRVFVYYQAGFLPSVPSVSNAFIALYFYVKYLKTESRKSFVWSIFFVTLAALSRLPFAILLAAIIIIEAFRSVIHRKPGLWKWICLILSVLFIGLYFLYNRHLQHKYGSIFLNYALPPRNFQEFKLIVKWVWSNWIYQYFTKVHYYTFIILILAALLTFVFRSTVLQKIHKQLLLMLILTGAGYTIYSIMMIQQFRAHDYYFLDTFYFPAILLLVLMVSILSEAHKLLKYPVIFLLFLACLFIIPRVVTSQQIRRLTGSWDHTETTIRNFRDSKDFLTAANVPDAAKILVIDAYAPNIPFILMNRMGFAVLTTSRKNIDEALSWEFDYIIIQNEFLVSEVLSNYPELINRIERLTGDGKITLYSLLPEPKQQNLYTFLGLQDKSPVIIDSCAFETVDSIWNKRWKKIKLTSEVSYNGRVPGVVNKRQEFGLTYQLVNPEIFRTGSRLVFFKGQFLRKKDLQECSIIASVSSAGKSLFYNYYELQDLITKTNQWQEVNLFFQVPKIEEKDFKLEVYIWNKGGNTLYFDDTGVSIY